MAAVALSPAGVVRALLLGLIRLYQLTLSPWLGLQCRYEPTCSKYAAEALERYGVAAASGSRRSASAAAIPWGGSGYDPVPAARRAAGREAVALDRKLLDIICCPVTRSSLELLPERELDDA